MRRNWAVGGMLVLAVAAVASAAGAASTRPTTLRFHVGKQTTVVTAPLKADGSPDYVAALNEKYGKGVTPDNNGFVVFLQAAGVEAANPTATRPQMLEMCGAAHMAKPAHTWVSFRDFLAQWKGPTEKGSALLDAEWAPWEEKDHPAVAAFLKAQKAELDLMVKAAGMPHWWCPYVSRNGTMLGVLFTGLGPVHEMTDALRARAMLREKSGNFDGFLTDVMAAMTLGRKVAGGEMLLEWFAGANIEESAKCSLGAVLGIGKLSVKQCEAVRHALATVAPMPSMAEALDTGERWLTLDTIVTMSKSRANQLFAQEDANGIGALGTIEQQEMNYDIVMQLANQGYDEIVAASRATSWTDMKAKFGAVDKQLVAWEAQWKKKNSRMLWMDTGESKAAYSRRVGQAILCVLLADQENAGKLALQQHVSDEMLDALLAAAEVKAKTGQWPATLQALVPTELAAVSADPFADNAPVKYLVRGSKARVYSVGTNGTDDGGARDRNHGTDDIAVGAKLAK